MRKNTSGSPKPVPSSASRTAVRAEATAMTATTVAVSTLPIGGNTLRKGKINQLVARTMASAIGSRKFARTNWNRRRSRNASVNSHSSVSTMYLIASIFIHCRAGRRGTPRLPGVLRGTVLRGEFGGAAVGGRHGVCDDSTKASRVENVERRRGGAAFGGDLLTQRAQRFVREPRHLRGS